MCFTFSFKYIVSILFLLVIVYLVEVDLPEEASVSYVPPLDSYDPQCHSRFQYDKYTPSKFHPSSNLLQHLQDYEELHSSCMDEFHRNTTTTSNCKFLVWLPATYASGLGNKIIGLVSSFLYALLTNRTLLITKIENTDKLFCDPFPRSSWLLPDSVNHFPNNSARFGKLVEQRKYNKSYRFPDTVYAYLCHDYDRNDKKFFCEEEQSLLARETKWIYIRSMLYYVPSLYQVPSFRSEIGKMFPRRETIFHLLARYLLHPSNPVWHTTVSYYDTHLAQADDVVGLQMRVFNKSRGPDYASEVQKCLLEKNILGASNRITVVVITSLRRQHFDVNKSHVTFYQPSHDVKQLTGNLEHDQKALMEIYLLSLCNILVTSPLSTFGYVAQGLAGIGSWQMWSSARSGEDVCSHVASPEQVSQPYMQL